MCVCVCVRVCVRVCVSLCVCVYVSLDNLLFDTLLLKGQTLHTKPNQCKCAPVCVF